MAAKLSQINGGVIIPYNSLTDAFVAVRMISGVPSDQQISLPPLTNSANMIATGTAPSAVVGTGAGTGGTLALGGSKDNSGVIAVTTGTTPSANAVIATLTFNQDFPNGASVVLTPSDAATLAVMPHVYAAGSKTAWALAATTALAAATTYTFNYVVVGF